MKRRRWTWIAFVAIACAAGTLVAALPALRPLDEPCTDLLFRLRGPVRPQGTPVAVVSIGRASLERLGWPWAADTAAHVLDRLSACGPRAVVLAFPTTRPAPSGPHRGEAGQGAAAPGTAPGPGPSSGPAPISAPASAPASVPPVLSPAPLELVPLAGRPYRTTAPLGPDTGIWLLPVGGRLRRVPLFYPASAGDPDPSLLAVALRAITGDASLPSRDAAGTLRLGDGRTLPLEPGRFGPSLRVNYAGDTATTFGAVSLLHVLTGQVDEELRGRVVVVGPVTQDLERGYATPTTGDTPMPGVEVIAHALDTALRPGQAFWRLPTWAVALSLALLVLLQTLASRQLRPLAAGAVTAGLLLVVLAAASAWFERAVLLPVAPAAVALVTAYLGLALTRVGTIDEDLETLTEELRRLDKRFYASQDDDDGQRWRRALDLAAMFIEVESVLLLRTDPETDRLEVVAGLRIGPGDIEERRRDIHRSPYREAGDPTRLVIRPGYIRKERKVSSLLCPITVIDHVLGFLVINRFHTEAGTFAADEEVIRFIAQQIGTLLRREQLTRRRVAGRMAALKAVVRHDRLDRRLRRLQMVTHRILEKKNTLYSTINAVQDGVAICDIFGQLVLYNEALAAVFARAEITLGGRNMVDLIHDVSGLERSAVIQRFRGVVTGEAFDLVVTPGDGQAGRYRLSLAAVHGPGRTLIGLVAVFTDISSLAELDRVKTNLLNLVSYRALNILTSIQGYSELLLEAEGLTEDEVSFVQTIHAESMSLAEVFDSFQTMASLDIADQGLKLRPLDLVHLAREAYEEVGQAAGKEVALDLTAPERFDIVAADRDLIARALREAVGFALENAERGSTLKIMLVEEERYLRLDLENQGYGMDRDTAASVFSSDAEKRGPLRAVKEVFEVHGGTVKAEGRIGEGLKLHLWLPLFMKGA